jgi:Uma2 family endonuclease
MVQVIEEPQVWRLSVERYQQMVASGIITDDDPVELLQGRLIAKMSKNPPHRLSNRLLRKALEKLVPEGWYVEAQEPVTTADSQPEPDISVIKGSEFDYKERHPLATEVGLVAEVADSTLKIDRGLKKKIYAQAGISQYWIVNLIDRQVEVYQNPSKGSYSRQQIYTEQESLPLVLEGVMLDQLAVRDILP